MSDNLKATISLRRTLRLVKPNIDHSSAEEYLREVFTGSMLLINSTKPILSKTNYYLKIEEVLPNRVKIKINQFHLLSEYPEGSEEKEDFAPVKAEVLRGETFKWQKPILGTQDYWEIKVLDIK